MAYVEGEIPTVVNTGNGYNNGLGGFGWGGDSWLAVIALLAIFGGFGNGFGFGGNSSGILNNYALGSDSAMLSRQLESGFNSLERKGDYIQEQLCNQTDTMLTGFSNVNTNIMQTGFGITNALNGGFNTTNSNLAQMRYDNAINTCNLQHSMCQNTRDIIDNQNANARQIVDLINANKLEEKNETIAMLRSRVGSLELSASQQAQNNYLINQLQPTPKPAYLTASPYQSYYGYPYGFGNGGTTIQ